MEKHTLKTILLQRQMNINELADKTEIPASTLYAKARGESDFKRSEMLKIKEVLSLTSDEFKDLFLL